MMDSSEQIPENANQDCVGPSSEYAGKKVYLTFHICCRLK